MPSVGSYICVIASRSHVVTIDWEYKIKVNTPVKTKGQTLMMEGMKD